MKFADYMRKVEKFNEERVDRNMKNFEYYGVYERYVNYCLENGIEREAVEEIIHADSW